VAESAWKSNFTSQVSASQRWSDSERPVWQRKSTEKTWRSKLIATLLTELSFSQRPGAYADHMRHKLTSSFCLSSMRGNMWKPPRVFRTGVESGGVTLRMHLIAVILPAFDLPFNAQRSSHSAWVGWSSYKYPERLIRLSSLLCLLNGFQSFSPCCIVSQSLFPLSFPSPPS